MSEELKWDEHPWELVWDNGVLGCKILQTEYYDPDMDENYYWRVHDLSVGCYSSDNQVTDNPMYDAWVKNKKKMTWDNHPILANGFSRTLKSCKKNCLDAMKALEDLV